MTLPERRFSTPSYNSAALQVLLQEANQLAQDLQLSETVPITSKDVLAVHIEPPFSSDHSGGFGSISTTNYHYYAPVGNKLRYVVRNLGSDDEREAVFNASLKRRYTAPRSRIDTNTAYSIVVQLLEAAHVDVQGLERDSRIVIRTWEFGDQFVPVYSIAWTQPYEAIRKSIVPHDNGYETVAGVEFLAPERRILQLHVNRDSYLKRKPLAVPKRELLLQQTNDPKMRQFWVTTSAYRQAALEVMLNDVNRLCQDLGFLDKPPVDGSCLTKVLIETPYVADHYGRFGTIYTDDYIYAAIDGNKLSYINRSRGFKGDEPKYLSMLKARYSAPRSQMNTNAAYMLATQWLNAASADVEGLERDCVLSIAPWNLDGNRFVPLYTVEWAIENHATRERTIAATVEVLEPERSLEKLWVEKPKYLKRDPLTVPDRNRLLEVTDTE